MIRSCHYLWSTSRFQRNTRIKTKANAPIRTRGPALFQTGGGRTLPPSPPVPTQEPRLLSLHQLLITSLAEWARMLRTHTHEQLSSLLTQYNDYSCIPCEDASSVSLLRPSQIKRYVHGAWQDIQEVYDCMEGIFKILQIDPSISLLKQQDMD